MSVPPPGKPADPIVFGPEYSPTEDPQSVRAHLPSVLVPPTIGVTRRGTPVKAPVTQGQPLAVVDEGIDLINGQTGRGKTPVTALMRQMVLASRRNRLNARITNRRDRIQRRSTE